MLKKKQDLDRKAKQEWLIQKREFEQAEEDQRNDYQSILKEIKESKNKMRKLQKTLDEREKALRQVEKEQTSLQHQKREKAN